MHRRIQRTTFFVLMLSAALAAGACKRRPEAAEVHVSLKEAPGSLTSATVLVDYSHASATPVRSGGEPACAAIAPNVTGHFTDDGQGSITMHASSREGFSAPIDLAICRMIPDEAGVSAEAIGSRLRVSLLAATDVAGKPVEERRLAHAETAGESQGHAPLDEAGSESGRAPHRERLEAERRQAGEAAEQAPAAATQPGERLAQAAPAPAAGQPHATPETGTPRSLIPENSGASSRANAPGAESDRGNTGNENDGNQDVGREDSNEDTDTDPKAIAYELTVSVKNAVGDIGALQFNIVHQGSGGGFAGAHGTARCRPVVQALSSFNDVGNGTLRAGLIDTNGFKTPGPVVSCTFKSRGSVSSGDFAVEVTDATDAQLKPVKPELAVTDIQRLGD